MGPEALTAPGIRLTRNGILPCLSSGLTRLSGIFRDSWRSAGFTLSDSACPGLLSCRVCTGAGYAETAVPLPFLPVSAPGDRHIQHRLHSILMP